MWTSHTENIQNGRIQKVTIHTAEAQLRYSEVLSLWRDDDAFCVYFNNLLACAPYDALFWENPPLTIDTIDRPFEFVIIDAPQLARVQANPRPFENRFTDPLTKDSIVSFANLRNDAYLVTPRPEAELNAYTHIAAFVRKAPEAQRRDLWSGVAEAISKRLDKHPLWLSTSGLGVYWLHVRLDSRPKYYSYRPYSDAAQPFS